MKQDKIIIGFIIFFLIGIYSYYINLYKEIVILFDFIYFLTLIYILIRNKKKWNL